MQFKIRHLYSAIAATNQVALLHAPPDGAWSSSDGARRDWYRARVMRRSLLRLGLALVLAVPLALVHATPAHAADGDLAAAGTRSPSTPRQLST
mgnify:CR=1 FL=1